MATLREYYEKDFSHSTKIHVKVPYSGEQIEGAILYDFAGLSAFLALYVAGVDRDINYYVSLLASLSYGISQVIFDGKVTLPSAKEFPGQLRIEKKEDFDVLCLSSACRARLWPHRKPRIP